ncbi:MAG: hypothetical protein KDB73_16275, partial [Planctomycetes bacterium]|nr:hypothetical protein [Planctomycetota bacterium]
GGADGTPAGAPSGAAKEKMRAAAAGVGGVLKSLASTFGLDVKRASVADLTRVHATDSERAAQAAQTPPVTDAGAQDHFAWRLSTLRLSIWLLGASFVVALISFITTLASYESAPGLRLWVMIFPELAKLLAAGYLVFEVVRALAGGIHRPGRANRQLRRGWAIGLVVPLAVLLLPWSSMIVSITPEEIARMGNPVEQLQMLLTVEITPLILLVMILLQALPALLSVFPGLFRAGLTMKTLVPTRGLGPVAAAAAGPFNALYLIVLLVIAQGIIGSWGLPFVALFLLGAPILTGWHCAALTKPMDAQRASAGVRRVRTASRILLAIGAIGFLVMLANTKLLGRPVFAVADSKDAQGNAVEPLVGLLDLLQLGVHLAGVMMVFTVVASDTLFRLSPLGDDDTPELAADAATLRQVKAALSPAPDVSDTFA